MLSLSLKAFTGALYRLRVRIVTGAPAFAFVHPSQFPLVNTSPVRVRHLATPAPAAIAAATVARVLVLLILLLILVV